MDKSLKPLCEALKNIFRHIKPQSQAFSFLLVTGKLNQGKTTLLRQANMTHYPLDADSQAHFFYNQHGIILELGEAWLNESDVLIANTLKELNRCHPQIRISGLILCIDSNELVVADSTQLLDYCKAHAQLLTRFGHGLGYSADVAIFFTKVDVLAGFCEFFQTDHQTELTKPLGFSLTTTPYKNKLLDHCKQQFDQMVEILSQKIINKLHPARSSAKRTLIREFPLQLSILRLSLLSLIQNLSTTLFRLTAVYFTSAEQGGLSIDKLNKRIAHEYALVVQDQFPQATNYRPYFVEGALQAFQSKTLYRAAQISSVHKKYLGLTVSTIGLLLIWFTSQYLKTSHLLDETSKELLTYETLIEQNKDKTAALYHLSLASSKIAQIPFNIFPVSVMKSLKTQIMSNTQEHLKSSFLPELLSTIEKVISDNAHSPYERYFALKIYLMLATPSHYSETDVINWFATYWNTKEGSEKQLLLLRNALKQPMQPLDINRQLVIDTRNYLNALPQSYFYYSLAKHYFPSQTKPISIPGFQLASQEIPIYYTKSGFKDVIAQLPQIAHQLEQESWILEQPHLTNLSTILEQAYCFEYTTWWQTFMHRTHLNSYQNIHEAQQLIQTLDQSHSLTQAIELLQEHTRPELGQEGSLFNQSIASSFTNLNLMSASAVNELNLNMNELEKFLTTVSLVNDEGKTIFDITKARFQSNTLSDPISTLYNKAHQFPEPISVWAKQIADDTWAMFITETRAYLNKQWNTLVYNPYQASIINRYPFDSTQKEEVNLTDFNQFFSPGGTLNAFIENYLKTFLDTSNPQWQPKAVDGYMVTLSNEMTNELIRANVISTMFFPENSQTAAIEFSLQKISLDPMVSNLTLSIGKTTLTDNQSSESYTQFNWPQSDAKLSLHSIDGQQFEIEETGPWALFKMLQKVNVLVDSEDSASLQILFEINGNSGRYILKTKNQINPYSPGILAGFFLKEQIA